MPIRHQTSIPSLIIAPHAPKFTQFMKVKAGEIVTVGKEDDQYPGWVWCTDSHGVSNWVPKEFLKIHDTPQQAVGHEGHEAKSIPSSSLPSSSLPSSSLPSSSLPSSSFQRKLESSITRAEFLVDYDATELTVQVGETVIVYSEQSGWLWCQTVAGQWGWVPKECVAR